MVDEKMKSFYKELEKAIKQAKSKMQKAAKELDFISAAQYRDEMQALEKRLKK